MERELTEAELRDVKAGMPLDNDASTGPYGQVDELSLDQLDNIYGAIPREMINDKVMANPELYREKAINALVEEAIKAEELSGGDDSASLSGRAM